MIQSGLVNLKALSFIALLAAIPSLAYATNEEDARDRFHAAISECASELGLPAPQPGVKPPRLSDEQRQAMDLCLAKQGVQPPGPPPGGHRGGKFHEKMHACLEASGVSVPPPVVSPVEEPPLLDGRPGCVTLVSLVSPPPAAHALQSTAQPSAVRRPPRAARERKVWEAGNEAMA